MELDLLFHLGRCGVVVTSLIVHILKTSQAFELSDPLKSSPGSHSQSVSNSVAITRSFLCLFVDLLVCASHLQHAQ